MELWSDGVMEVVEPEAGIEPAAYGLQNRCSTAELFRQLPRIPNVAQRAKWDGGQGGIRTPEGISQQIYSLPRLTASVPAR